ncbi:HlyC/CorC family transporter [Candidatus Woesearchaeota archaeon]|nr:MAG: HlyC/CorC family transporter [Candidatus Woesearchaeota archaeon]
MYESQIVFLLALIGLSGVFSGVETALMSVSMIKVKSLLKQKKRGSEALHRIKHEPHKLIITVLIGNNLVNIGAASLATVLFTNIFGSSGAGIATGVMTFFILVFGEIIPKTFCAQNAETISLIAARPVELLIKILWPLVKLFEALTKVVSRIMGSKDSNKLSIEEVKTVVSMGEKEGLIEKEAAEIMHNVLEFRDTKVNEIMTPKPQIDMVDGEKTIKDVINFVIKSPYSRFPVYQNNKNNIIGILDVDDILIYIKSKRLGAKIKRIAKETFFVPESKEINDLLYEFEGKKIPMAIVVNEYGDVTGLVTMEDILEEIVGDIFDKSKKSSKYVKKLSKNIIRINASIPIDEINKLLKLNIQPKNFSTLAGYIESKLRRIPKKGESIKFKHFKLEIDEVSEKGIKSVRIIKN